MQQWRRGHRRKEGRERTERSFNLPHSSPLLLLCPPPYPLRSLWTRSVEADIVPTCRELGIAIMAYSPLGRGFLTGRIRSAADIAEGDYRGSSPRFMGENLDKNLQIVAALEEKAKSKGCTAGQLALAWVHAQGARVALSCLWLSRG